MKHSKRLLKVVARVVLVTAVIAIAAFGSLVTAYLRIVSAGPGKLDSGVQPMEFGKLVDPFIGTGGWPWLCSHNFPGAMVPFGMVRLGPETVSILTRTRALNTSGYYYGDGRVLGFSHTRLNGTGAVDGGHFLITPALGPITPGRLRSPPAFCFSHREETASPGYYAVHLSGPGMLVELTATPRVGVHRYTFESREKAHLYVDVSNSLGGKRSAEGRVVVLPGRQELEGQIRTFGSFASRYGGLKVYFVARFDRPFLSFSTWKGDAISSSAREEGDKVGADLEFDTRDGKPITLKLAISHVSVENARLNLDFEAGDDFAGILSLAQKSWEDRLSLIQTWGGTEKQQKIFRTALYRVFQMPTLFSDQTGDYPGFDGKSHKASGHNYYTDLSLWDTFRTVHPLYTLIAPADHRDMIVSLILMMKQGGWLPRWPSGVGYSNSMLGTPADIVIAEAFLKGIHDLDVEGAYAAMRQTALAPVPAGSRFSGREGVEHYLKHKYCPSDLMEESVSRTFEFGWADSAISHLAEALGKTEDAELFRRQASNYQNLWNDETQFFQPRDSQGRFSTQFKPLLLTYFDFSGKYTKAYVEGSALQWRWGAPYDGPGMVHLFRSRNYFVEELNRFFEKSNSKTGRWDPGPYYWHGNQPDIHAAYLFNDAGRPDLTQKWVRWILETKYGDRHDGLDGNDDGGTLSAWYVFSALGLYPVAGSDTYHLGAPLFERTQIKMGTNLLTIIAETYSSHRFYAQSVSLNDRVLDRTWIRHHEIERGGTLRFKMSDKPRISAGAPADGATP